MGQDFNVTVKEICLFYKFITNARKLSLYEISWVSLEMLGTHFEFLIEKIFLFGLKVKTKILT